MNPLNKKHFGPVGNQYLVKQSELDEVKSKMGKSKDTRPHEKKLPAPLPYEKSEGNLPTKNITVVNAEGNQDFLPVEIRTSTSSNSTVIQVPVSQTSTNPPHSSDQEIKQLSNLVNELKETGETFRENLGITIEIYSDFINYLTENKLCKKNEISLLNTMVESLKKIAQNEDFISERITKAISRYQDPNLSSEENLKLQLKEISSMMIMYSEDYTDSAKSISENYLKFSSMFTEKLTKHLEPFLKNEIIQEKLNNMRIVERELINKRKSNGEPVEFTPTINFAKVNICYNPLICMQRMTKLPLLFKEILKNTTPWEDQYKKPILGAYEALNHVTEEMNKKPKK